MKGRPTLVDLHLQQGRHPDRSWGIFKDGGLLGLWEPAESAECMRTYLSLVGAGVFESGVGLIHPLRAALALEMTENGEGCAAG